MGGQKCDFGRKNEVLELTWEVLGLTLEVKNEIWAYFGDEKGGVEAKIKRGIKKTSKKIAP